MHETWCSWGQWQTLREAGTGGGDWSPERGRFSISPAPCTHRARLTESRGSSAVQGSDSRDKIVEKWDALQRGRVNPLGFKSLTLSGLNNMTYHGDVQKLAITWVCPPWLQVKLVHTGQWVQCQSPYLSTSVREPICICAELSAAPFDF